MSNRFSRARRVRRRDVTRARRSLKRIAAEAFFSLFHFLYYLFYRSNNAIDVSRYECANAKIPNEFDGLTIAQVSDLHGKVFGRDSKPLFDALIAAKPDVIFITGDLVDERAFDLDFVADFVERLTRIAPTLYITGNHEGNFYDDVLASTVATVEASGATPLFDRALSIVRKGNALVFEPETTRAPSGIVVAGVSDPIRAGDGYAATLEASLSRVKPTDARFRILLSHRPETLELYARYGFDLVFSGHAHGGQFRFPIILPNGLNAPHQGWFPKLTRGKIERDATTLIVSRGLGPSVLPTRLFNRPELVICRLVALENGEKVEENARQS